MPRVSAGLSVDRFDYHGAAVLVLTGDLDRNTCGEVETWLRRLVAQGHRAVGLDLERVHRLDARGVSAIVSCCERMRAARRALRLVSASAQVRDVLLRHGLHHLLPEAGERPCCLAS